MLVVETVVRIRREHAGGKPIKAIARDLHLSRKVVRKAIRAPEGAFDYQRAVQPLPRIGPFQERLDALLTENEARPRRDRLRMTRIHDLLLREGFEGSYDAVRRYARRWSNAVTTVFIGKERVFNRRFLVMADHYMVEPTACSPAAGWEKGQVENQVQTIRGRFFQPRLRFASLEELNGWLEDECQRWAAMHPHPEQKDMTVAQAWEAERLALQPMLAPFDGFHETSHAVTGTCLISFDRNRYSVAARAVRRAVQVRAYADRIVVRLGEEIVAEHPRFFGRDRTVYDPWHYLPVLVTKPGALRNGAPFQGWDLPPALARLRRKLSSGDEGDRRFVRVLAAVLSDSLGAVEAAVREALDAGAASDEVILNILSRRREPPRPASIVTPEDMTLRHPPVADCARYDNLRGAHAAA
ncbi:hypothetical protein [Croceicoccus sp. Ery5]|uniref:Mu transposase domain-containing protein n=1 Tax=Croceicoccus sp. Ery5 TaxID=1703340 RepID=UPI001E35B5CA|nr:hypothetical protein [Croceicoccus sp. Ery5]